jgi:hypothetical protein
LTYASSVRFDVDFRPLDFLDDRGCVVALAVLVDHGDRVAARCCLDVERVVADGIDRGIFLAPSTQDFAAMPGQRATSP